MQIGSRFDYHYPERIQDDISSGRIENPVDFLLKEIKDLNRERYLILLNFHGFLNEVKGLEYVINSHDAMVLFVMNYQRAWEFVINLCGLDNKANQDIRGK